MGRARRLAKAAGMFALAMAALYVHFLMGSLALLNSWPLHRALNPRPEHLRVDWTFAWSPWPGHVHARGLRIVGQGLEIQWELGIDRAHGKVAILPLFRRVFTAADVEAYGASLRLRPTVAPTPQRLLQAEVFPPIEGVEDPPIRFEGPLRPPEENAWTVQLRDARFHTLDEVWIGPYRTRGAGKVSGSLETRAGWSIHFDAEAALRDAKVFIGARPVVEGGTLEVEAAMNLPDVPHSLGPERFRALKATVRARSDEVSLALIGQHAPELSRMIRGSGALELEAALDGGELLPGSSLRFHGTGGRYAIDRAWAVAAERFELTGAVSPTGATRLMLSATPLSLLSHAATLMRSPRVTLKVEAPNAIVVPPLPNHRLALEVERTDPAPVKRFERWLWKLPVALEGGMVTLEAGAHGERKGLPAGGLQLSLRDARGSFPGGTFEGDVQLQLSLERLVRGARLLDLSGSGITIDGLSMRTELGEVKGWRGRFSLEAATLRAESRRLTGVLRGEASSARPLLLLARPHRHVRRFLSARDLALTAELDLSPWRLLTPRFQLEGDGVSLRGALLRDDRGTFGALLARVRGVPLGITFNGSDSAVSFAVRDVWLRERLEHTGVAQAIDAAGPGIGGSGR